MTTNNVDLVLRRQEGRRASPLEIRRGGETSLHGHQLHASPNIRPHGAEGRQRRKDQLQQLADPEHHEQRKGRGRQSPIDHVPRLCKSQSHIPYQNCAMALTDPTQIDVRDLAELQILALTTPGAANKRFVVGFPMMFNRFAEALRTVPELASRIGENNDDDTALAPARFGTDEANEVFQFKYRSLQETAKDIAASIIKIEAA